MTAIKPSRQFPTVKEHTAIEKGFVSVTTGYKEQEYSLLERAINTMRGARFILVDTYEGIQIFRHKTQIRTKDQ